LDITGSEGKETGRKDTLTRKKGAVESSRTSTEWALTNSSRNNHKVLRKVTSAWRLLMAFSQGGEVGRISKKKYLRGKLVYAEERGSRNIRNLFSCLTREGRAKSFEM